MSLKISFNFIDCHLMLYIFSGIIIL